MPCRSLTTSKKGRWFNDLSIIAINTVLLRLVFLVPAIGMAQKAQANGWGLLNHFGTSSVIELVVGIVTLDLVIYLQHVMFHAVPILWRVHMVHHADLDYDLTTELKFHPVEMILSMILKITIIVALGPWSTCSLCFNIRNNFKRYGHVQSRQY